MRLSIIMQNVTNDGQVFQGGKNPPLLFYRLFTTTGKVSFWLVIIGKKVWEEGLAWGLWRVGAGGRSGSSTIRRGGLAVGFTTPQEKPTTKTAGQLEIGCLLYHLPFVRLDVLKTIGPVHVRIFSSHLPHKRLTHTHTHTHTIPN